MSFVAEVCPPLLVVIGTCIGDDCAFSCIWNIIPFVAKGFISYSLSYICVRFKHYFEAMLFQPAYCVGTSVKDNRIFVKVECYAGIISLIVIIKVDKGYDCHAIFLL